MFSSVGASLRLLWSSRFRASVRRECPLLGVVVVLLLGQMLGGIPGRVPIYACVLGLLSAGVGAWRRGERIVIGALVFIVGIVSTMSVVPRSIALPAESVWRGEIEESPRYSKTGAIGLTLRAVPEGGSEGGVEPIRLVCTAVDLPWRNIGGVEQGDRFFFRAILTPLELTVNPFGYPNLLRRRGVSASCRITHATPVLHRARSVSARLRSGIEHRIAHVVGDGEMWGLLLSMSIGSRDTLSVETERAFKATGLTHLLIVSGFQVTLVYYLISQATLLALGRLRRVCVWLPAEPIARILGLAMSFGFVALAGADGSSIRAAFAVVFTVVARSLERGGGLFNGIVVSLLGVSLVWPGAVLEPGVELTYAALLGICLGREMFPRREGYRGVAASVLGVTIGVWLLSSIVTLGWFRTFSPAGLLLNPLLAPLLGLLGCHGSLIGWAAHASGLDPTGSILRAVGGALIGGRDLVVAIARSGVAIPELSRPIAGGCALVLGLVSAGLLQRQLRTRFLPLGRTSSHAKRGDETTLYISGSSLHSP